MNVIIQGRRHPHDYVTRLQGRGNSTWPQRSSSARALPISIISEARVLQSGLERTDPDYEQTAACQSPRSIAPDGASSSPPYLAQIPLRPTTIVISHKCFETPNSLSVRTPQLRG